MVWDFLLHLIDGTSIMVLSLIFSFQVKNCLWVILLFKTKILYIATVLLGTTSSLSIWMSVNRSSFCFIAIYRHTNIKIMTKLYEMLPLMPFSPDFTTSNLWLFAGLKTKLGTSKNDTAQVTVYVLPQNTLIIDCKVVYHIDKKDRFNKSRTCIYSCPAQ